MCLCVQFVAYQRISSLASQVRERLLFLVVSKAIVTSNAPVTVGRMSRRIYGNHFVRRGEALLSLLIIASGRALWKLHKNRQSRDKSVNSRDADEFWPIRPQTIQRPLKRSRDREKFWWNDSRAKN